VKTFKDTENRDWTVEITVGAVKRVRAALDVDLYSLIDDKAAGLAKLMNDPCMLVAVIFVLCREQAEKQEVSEEQFGNALGGDTLEACADAFLEALTDFFPSRSRAPLRKIAQKGKQISEKATALLEKRIDALDVDTEVEKLTATSGK